MSKKVVSTLFSIVFLLLITVPTILVIVNDTTDASIFFSTSEEGEKGSEKDLEIEVLLSTTKINNADSVSISSENNLVYYYKKYAKPYLNIFSPPPDSHIA